MQTLSTVCTTGQTEESVVEQEIMSLLIIGGVFILLWLLDTRNWHQIGSILFLIITLFVILEAWQSYESTILYKTTQEIWETSLHD